MWNQVRVTAPRRAITLFPGQVSVAAQRAVSRLITDVTVGLAAAALSCQWPAA